MRQNAGEDTVDRVSEDTKPERRVAQSMVRPATDIVETEHAYEVLVDLPGCGLRDISVVVYEDVLEVDATREVERRGQGDTYVRNARMYGSVSRAYALPGHIDPVTTTASCGDGVLRVRMPKSARCSPLRVDVPIAPWIGRGPGNTAGGAR